MVQSLIIYPACFILLYKVLTARVYFVTRYLSFAAVHSLLLYRLTKVNGKYSRGFAFFLRMPRSLGCRGTCCQDQRRTFEQNNPLSDNGKLKVSQLFWSTRTPALVNELTPILAKL